MNSFPEDLVPIAKQIPRRTVPRKGLTKLLGCPLRSWMSSHAEVQNTPPIVSKNQEDIQQLEPDRGHGEEVYRYYALHVILKEGPPSLGRRFSQSNHVFGYRWFGNLNAQLEQLAMNAWCTPARLLRLIIIRFRTSCGTQGRPGFPR
jgi:hypothetical protein